MKQQTLLIVICLLISVITISEMQAVTRTVPNEYPTINEALAVSLPYDTIMVIAPGTDQYIINEKVVLEFYIYITTSRLVPSDVKWTYGASSDTCIIISGNDPGCGLEISGFTFENEIAIYCEGSLNANHCVFQNCGTSIKIIQNFQNYIPHYIYANTFFCGDTAIYYGGSLQGDIQNMLHNVFQDNEQALFGEINHYFVISYSMLGSDRNDTNNVIFSNNIMNENVQLNTNGQFPFWAVRYDNPEMSKTILLGIDSGNPYIPLGNEPEPNGGIINLGAFGGTYGAETSPENIIAYESYAHPFPTMFDTVLWDITTLEHAYRFIYQAAELNFGNVGDTVVVNFQDTVNAQYNIISWGVLDSTMITADSVVYELILSWPGVDFSGYDLSQHIANPLMYDFAFIVDYGETVVSCEPNINPSKINSSQLTCSPNPFNQTTAINYTLTKPATEIEFSFWNIQGQIIDLQRIENIPPGNHQFIWNAPSALTSGTYFVRTKGYATEKLIFIK